MASVCVSTVSAVSSSAAGPDKDPGEYAPINQQTGLSAVVAGGAGAACTDPLSPMVRTLLTVLTVFSSVLRILIILFPARPSRLNVISMLNARKNCARRRPAASARTFTPADTITLSSGPSVIALRLLFVGDRVPASQRWQPQQPQAPQRGGSNLGGRRIAPGSKARA